MRASDASHIDHAAGRTLATVATAEAASEAKKATVTAVKKTVIIGALRLRSLSMAPL
jgi:hypothetical protein